MPDVDSVGDIEPDELSVSMGIVYLVLSVTILFVLVIWGAYENDVRPEVIVLIASLLITIIGWFVKSEHERIENSKERRSYQDNVHAQRKHEIELEHKRRISEIQLQNYPDRRETYQGFVDIFQKSSEVARGTPGATLPTKEEIMDLTMDLQLIGSDEVCQLWNEIRILGQRPTSSDASVPPERTMYMIVIYARIILSIRRDLGNENTGIDEISVLRSFVNDLDPMIPQLREIMKKSIEEIP